MSRVIKFRGMGIDGTWRYGLLSKPKAGNYAGQTFISNKAGMSMGYGSRPETVGQFTGLLDKNGVEIYEGDIVYFSYGIPSVPVNAPVVFGSAMFWVETRRHNPKRCPLHELKEHVGEYEVIGNIYENPELLETD